MNWAVWELRRLSRDRAFILSGLLLIICIFVSLIYGQSEISQQVNVIDKLENITSENDQLYFKKRFKEGEHIGRALYYLSQPIAHSPWPESILSIGQRDLHSYHQVVRARSLYMNLFDSGFSNPFKSSMGHFDFAFVIIFLLPLFIIATNFDLISKDRENGVLSLLLSQGGGAGKVLLWRLSIRFLSFFALIIALTIPTFFYLNISPSITILCLALILMYLVFWFSVCLIINNRGWSSSQNAGVLLGIWVILTLIGPSSLNLILGRDATSSGAAVTLQARQMINNGWDIDKEITADKVLAKEGRYSRQQMTQEKFHWSWYYAMHDAADFSVAEKAQSYFRGLEEKYTKTKNWSFFFIPVRVQIFFDELASTDLLSHLSYYNYVKVVREEMRDHFLPRLVDDEKISKQELLNLYQKVPLRTFKPQKGIMHWRAIFETIIFIFILLLLAFRDLKNIEKRLVS